MASGTIKVDGATSKSLKSTTSYISNARLLAIANLRILTFTIANAPDNSTLCTLNAEDSPSTATTINAMTALSGGGQNTSVFTLNTNGTIVMSNGAAFRGTPMLIWTV